MNFHAKYWSQFEVLIPTEHMCFLCCKRWSKTSEMPAQVPGLAQLPI